jgi:hypothetical protein
MNEKLLQYIWQFGYFNKQELSTAAKQALQIIFPGRYNSNQGPDFSEAKIKIGNTTWAGSIELHVRASDWDKHEHSTDSNYRNVILHVVYENDISADHSIPVFELKDRIPKMLLAKYESMMGAGDSIPCHHSLQEVKEIVWTAWKETLVVRRLERKIDWLKDHLYKTNHHWEEGFWRLLARNFGMKINADAFEKMAETLPVNILAKHKNQLQQLEALLFGQLGLLEGDFEEDYPVMLQKEYRFLEKKYQLRPVFYHVYFLRMRPVNFPTLRLAQLAVLIQQSSHLFSKVIEAETVNDLNKLFDVTANDYWHYHYRFDEITEFKKKNLGKEMLQHIIINTVVPAVFF